MNLTSLQDALAFDVLEAGMSVAPNMMLVNRAHADQQWREQ